MEYIVQLSEFGPHEYEIRMHHRYGDEIYFFRNEFRYENNKECIEHAKSSLLDFIFNLWYQTHGQGD